MKKAKKKSAQTHPHRKPARVQSSVTGQTKKPVARWVSDGARRLLVLENAFCRVALWPDMGGAIVSYVELPSGLEIIWRNPYGQPARSSVLDQPMRNGSDLYDVMDGSWYVSLPNGFFAGDYFGAPLGTHGELRSVPWEVTDVSSTRDELRATLVGRSVRTPLIYRRELTLRRDSSLMRWRETLENRWSQPLPVAWLQHPTWGGPLLDGARLITPARTVRVFKADEPGDMQLESGYHGQWPHVPERASGRMRDCSVVPPAGTGLDHSVQLTDFDAGWGCVWNGGRGLGFGIEWDLKTFPYAWSWNCAGGGSRYPLWGEGHIITLQPSTSPVGRWPDLLGAGAVLTLPARGSVSTTMSTGFVHTASGPWSAEKDPR
jgi:hypothetical protein